MRTSRARLLADRAARLVVTAGGMTIILSILGILVFILFEVAPLAVPVRVGPGRSLDVVGAPPGALIEDEGRTRIATLGLDAVVRIYRIADGRLLAERRLVENNLPLVAAGATADGRYLTGTTRTGQVVITRIAWPESSAAGEGSAAPVIPEPIVLTVDEAGRPASVYAASADDNGNAAAAEELADGSLVMVRRRIEENSITGQRSESVTRAALAAPAPSNVLLLEASGTDLYGGTADGRLLWWSMAGGAPSEPRVASAGTASITALALLTGGRSLVAGQSDGSTSVWFPVRHGEARDLTRIRSFPGGSGPVVRIVASPRGRVFLALDSGGGIDLFASTSGRALWRGRSPVAAASAVAFAPRGDAAWFAAGGRLAALEIHAPHPEVSLKALVGRIWYEGYEKPEWVWQSTGGSDDFEPKLSLVPLLFGTLKGTLYSLILAVPLAVLGAMYASQFMHPRIKGLVKPVVEIMAALPSVVLGFLAGLWLAPRIERLFPSLILMLLILPAMTLAAGLLWRRLPRTRMAGIPAGSEILLFIAVLAAGMYLSVTWSAPFGAALFPSGFPDWLRQATGLPFDQRNAVIVGLAMGFAVIPIIFAIAEDAFSNVPPNLTSGSLALGATRWQTVTRVVLPAASPGIFSAIIVGFGRAIGETMIVVMATGNTPIMDWNPFNGFRTLSANIAVEIPEAPMGGSLYRTLFLAALLLFILTFAVNTAAEMIRHRLRRRYAVL